MNRNIKFLIAAASSAFFILLVQSSSAQEVVPDSNQVKPKAEWEVNTILNPFVAVLLGGDGGGQRNPIGFQVKRHVNNNAFRIGVDYSNQRPTFFGPEMTGRVVGRDLDTLIYLQHDYNDRLGRLQLGYEKGYANKRGRFYWGGDVSFCMGLKQQSARLYGYDMENKEYINGERFQDTRHEIQRVQYGFGLKPFLGIERSITNHLGFNLEAKFDMAMRYFEGVAVNDDATFSKAGNVIYLETLPLLDLRMYYRF